LSFQLNPGSVALMIFPQIFHSRSIKATFPTASLFQRLFKKGLALK